MRRVEHRYLRWLVIGVAMAMFSAACGDGDEPDLPTTTQAPAAQTTSTTSEESVEPDDTTPDTTVAVTEAPVADSSDAVTPGFTYKLALLSDPTTDNLWAIMDTEADVWNQYVLSTSLPSLYGSSFPSYTLVPGVAAEVDPPVGMASGDTWVIEVGLRDDQVWSDGTSITAHDVAFTFNTVKDVRLGGNWFSLFPMAAEDDPATEDNESSEGLISVDAIDDYTVRYTWSSQPGLAQWQFGAAQAPIFSAAFWKQHVDAAGEAGDLYAVSGTGTPSGGSMVFDRREPGAFARTIANPIPNDQGAGNIAYSTGGVSFSGDVSWEVGDTSGEVIADWTSGPFVTDAIYSVYDTQDAAVLALRDGEVDFLLNPLGLQRGLQATVLEAGDLEVIANPSNGFRYLAFNTRRFPGSESAFRQALACIINKEFMASNVLQGVAIPLDSMVPPGNAFWANPDIEGWCSGQSQEERVNSAVQILKDAGWTWEVMPEWNADNRDVIPKGEGLRGPDGTPVPPLELLAPGPGYDPLRATYSLFIADWANDLGIPLQAEPTGFSVIVDRVFGPVDWDMYILGWSLTTFPDHVADFFDSRADSATGEGFNTPGYSNPDLDRMADDLKAETDLNQAAEIVRRMDALLADDVPYIILFTTPVLETFRETLEFPSTTTLDGLQNFNGLPGSVNLAE